MYLISKRVITTALVFEFGSEKGYVIGVLLGASGAISDTTWKMPPILLSDCR